MLGNIPVLHWASTTASFKFCISTISSHPICRSLMKWEPAEGCGIMDVDERAPMPPHYLFHIYDPRICKPRTYKYMASTAIQEVLHMTSPIFTSQPLHFPLPLTETSGSSTLFLPRLEISTTISLVIHVLFLPGGLIEVSNKILQAPSPPKLTLFKFPMARLDCK